MTAQRAARIAAVLLIVTAGAFAVGVSAESDDTHDATSEAVDNGHDEGEVGDGAGEESGEGSEARAEAEADEERDILGVDPESPGVVAIAVILSAALAVALWIRSNRTVAALAVVFAALFAIGDLTEVAHQLDEDNNGLAAFALLIAVGHLAAAAFAGLAAARADLDPTQEQP